jgi:Ca-activated chloride channel family protein
VQLGSPYALAALALVEVLAMGFVWLALWRRRAAERFAGSRAAGATGGAYWARAVLVVLAATLAVVAMARPQWGSKEYSRQDQGIDLVVALDISQSMTAKDASPSRLGLAQSELAKLFDGLRGNRIGLVFFAGSAILRSPLSTDTQALSEIVGRADKEPGLTRAGSDIGTALDQAGRILDASTSPGKAVLVVSDGEDFGADADVRASQLGAKGVVIFTAGTGTASGSTIVEPVPNSNRTRVKTDASGAPVITKLNEANLKALAATGKGRYLHLGESGSSLLSLREDISQLQQAPLSQQTQRVPVERFQILVALALVALTLAWFVPERLPRLSWRRLSALRPRPGLAMLLLLALFAGACGAKEDPLRSRNGDANKLYRAGDFQGALAAYQKLQAQRPDVPEIAYNAGNALEKLGQLGRAVETTRRALPPPNTKLGVATYFALGNHYLAAGDLQSAYEAYRSALLLDPRDADSKYNLELTLAGMQQNPPGQQGQGQGQDQQDQGLQSGQGQSPDEQAPGGEAQPGQGQPPTGQQAQQPAQGPQGGQPSNQGDVQRALTEALKGIDQDFSFDEAEHILDLLNQLKQQQPTTPGGNRAGGPDY